MAIDWAAWLGHKEEDAKFMAVLDEQGEAKVRAGVANNTWGNRLGLVNLWLQKMDLEKEAERLGRELETLEATKLSAKAATESAKAANKSAFWAGASAVIAIGALIVAVIAIFVK